MEQKSTISIESPNYYTQFLEKVKVDSLKIRIPKEDVEIISSRFLQAFQKVYINHGDVDEHISLENHKTNVTNGITTRIGLVESLVAKSVVKEFIYIQVNAKMCEKRYFDGIGKETIGIIYNYIMALKVIFVSFDIFMDALVSDIDFAYDIPISPEHMKFLNQKMYNAVLLKKKKYLDEPFKRKDNVGISFNRREKATPTSPFIKIYHKGLEFANKSKEFCDFYFSGIDLVNYGRLEYTIKNAKHQKYLGIGIKTLSQLMDMDKSLIERIVTHGIKECYMEKGVKLIDYARYSPTDKLILYFLNQLVSKGADRVEIYKSLDVFDKTIAKERKDKTRMKGKIDSLINEISLKQELKKNERLNNAIRLLHLDGVI